MAGLSELRNELISDGEITANEVSRIKAYIVEDGRLDYADIKFLVGLMKDAKSVCPEFDDFFFPCMRSVILADGEVTMDEQYLLLQMLYSDGVVRDCERHFITELSREVTHVSPEFRELCETAANCDDRQWCTGGKDRGE